MRIEGRRRVHCSYHKCLTGYFQKVFGRLFASPFGPAGGYRHFDSRIDLFYRDCENFAVASVNNHTLDLDRFADIRVTRFIRDPRDLIVSGYFYHKRSAERWCDVVAPTKEDWSVVNGSISEQGLLDRSFAQYLKEAPLEEGLLAEMQFRRGHFESMRAWPRDDARIEVFRYEEILGNESATFERIFRFFDFPFVARQLGLHYARRFRAAKRAGRADHIRDPSSGQWRALFTPVVTKRFDDQYGDLIEKLGYPRS